MNTQVICGKERKSDLQKISALQTQQEQGEEENAEKGQGMKLFYYILDSDKNSKPILKTKVCEVIEKGGLYRPAEGHLPFGSYAVIPKRIAKLEECRWGRVIPYVVMLEPDVNLAKRLFQEYIDKKIAACKERIATLEEKRKIIENTEEWKEW